MQGGLGGESQHKSLVCYMAQDGLEEESDTKSEKKIATEKDAQGMVEEKLEEIDLGTNS